MVKVESIRFYLEKQNDLKKKKKKNQIVNPRPSVLQ